jgi:hypothetical protein
VRICSLSYSVSNAHATYDVICGLSGFTMFFHMFSYRLILVEGVCLQPFVCWDCGFESHPWHEYLCVVSVVCCQVAVFATGRCLVQRSPTEFVCVCVCVCVIGCVEVQQ